MHKYINTTREIMFHLLSKCPFFILHELQQVGSLSGEHIWSQSNLSTTPTYSKTLSEFHHWPTNVRPHLNTVSYFLHVLLFYFSLYCLSLIGTVTLWGLIQEFLINAHYFNLHTWSCQPSFRELSFGRTEKIVITSGLCSNCSICT